MSGVKLGFYEIEVAIHLCIKYYACNMWIPGFESRKGILKTGVLLKL